MLLKLTNDAKTINLERLIFVKPQETLDISISFDKDLYEPNDKVAVEISSKAGLDKNILTSVKVTDVSSLLKVPKYKHQPTLPSMVYLEKEALDQNQNIQEFLYSDDYVDFMFETADSQGFLERKSADYYLLYTDLMLGMQEWRRNLLDDVYKVEDLARNLDEDSEERLHLEYLLGRKIWSYMLFDAMPMMAEPMMMDEGFAEPEMAMMDAAPAPQPRMRGAPI